MKRRRFGSLPKIAMLGICIAAITVGASLAYLTATDVAHNNFNVEQALTDRIKVIEPHWEEDNGKNIVPTQTIAKDPQIENASNIPVYAFMQVSVPHATIVTATSEGMRNEAAAQELFTYTVNEGWREYGSGSPSQDGKHMVHTYLLDSALAAGKTSPSLFDEVTLVNAVDGQLDGRNLTIDVKGLAIQAEGFESAEEAWAACQNSR